MSAPKTFAMLKKIIKVSLVIFAFATISFAQAPKIEKVEPPNWWASHTINPVRLLVRGENFQNASVKSPDGNLKVSNIRVNENGTYVFFDVDISKDAKVGKYQFEVSNNNGKTLIPFEISPPLDAKTNFQGITNEDIIYLIMPDRFANGDTSNDAPNGSPKEANDRNNSRAWHGGDFKGVTSKLPYLKELGVTAIWLTPWYNNPDDVTNCDKPWCPNTNYHGYHAIDYYSVENRFGSMEDLREMIREAHKMGIKVVQDQVANHVGIQHVWSKNPPLKNWFSPYSQNTFNNSVLLSPNASEAERKNLLEGWFNELLPDLNQYEPEVKKYEIQNAVWWVGMTGVDGIRQDTIQYMPREFIRDWSVAIKKQYPNFWMVGEVFEEDSAQTSFFQGGKAGWDGIDTKLPSVFDFKLWRTSQAVFTGKKPARALRDILKYDGLYPDINNVVLLENNHDTDRFMSLEGATKEGAKLHTAFVLATRGIPQLYYGEEILMTGGHDPDNRKDFQGGWAEDKVNKFTKAGRTADEQEMFEWTRRWILFRKSHKSWQSGQTIDLYYDNETYVFARNSVCKPLCDLPFVFAFNSSDAEKIVPISADEFLPKDGEKLGSGKNYTYLESYTTNERVNAKNGKFYLTLPPKSAMVFEGNFATVVKTGD
jgi:glycosidase